MKYLFVNSVYGMRSTGKIVMEQCHKLQETGNQCMAAYGREAVEDPAVKKIKIGTPIDYHIHALLTRLLDLHGLCSQTATKKFLKAVEEYSPDVIWLHNLHGYYINYELLFDWLRNHSDGIRIYWTLHDCWAFTGHCAYFTMAGCSKWKTKCSKCGQLHTYPVTYGGDHTLRNYEKKKAAFTGIGNMTLVTPSEWLAGLVKESYLAEYPVKVIHNTVDTKIFRPTKSNFREKHNLNGKYVVLGVAVGWEQTKGFQDMKKLREVLNKQYTIVLVGTTKQQIEKLPRGMIGIERTKNQSELAAIYTAADVFVNPTHQDNYPTVNLEAAACGTPAVTYDVGGSPESVRPENIIPEGNIKILAKRIKEICEQRR